MKNVASLIARMEAVSSTTCNKREEALKEIKTFAPRIRDICLLLSSAEKNGLSVLHYQKDELFEFNFGVGRDYLMFQTDAKKCDIGDDRLYFIDCTGDVYSSKYASTVDNGEIKFSDTFKIGRGDPTREESNLRILRRLEQILERFPEFEQNVFEDIERQIEIKEGK